MTENQPIRKSWISVTSMEIAYEPWKITIQMSLTYLGKYTPFEAVIELDGERPTICITNMETRQMLGEIVPVLSKQAEGIDVVPINRIVKAVKQAEKEEKDCL